MNGGDRAEAGDWDRDRIRIECEHLRVSDGLADWGMGLNRVAPPSAAAAAVEEDQSIWLAIICSWEE